MKSNFVYSWGRVGAAAAILSLNACAPGQDTPTPTIAVDVSRYVAIGDSYTAGLSAGGLTRASQEFSYPNLIAQQLGSVSGNTSFTQPLLEAGTGSGYLRLLELTSVGIPRTQRVPGTAVRRTIINPAAFGGADTVRVLTRSATAPALPQNLGIPGLRLTQIETPNLGNETTASPTAVFNPYFERLLPAADGRTYLQATASTLAGATFFTFFLGLDDLMPYVRSGGQCGATPNSTLSTQMKVNARKILDQLAGRGVPGIIAQLPDLTTLPILRLGKGLELQARLQASTRDTARLYITGTFNSTVGQPVSNADYVLATAITRIGRMTQVLVGSTMMTLPYGRDIRNPVVDADVLDFDEVSRVNSVLVNYNRSTNPNPATGLSLEELAKRYRLPLISASQGESTLRLDNELFFPLASASYSFEGVIYSAEPVRGGAFSADSYTFTPRGNALLANVFIMAINKAYKAKLPIVNVNNYPTLAQ